MAITTNTYITQTLTKPFQTRITDGSSFKAMQRTLFNLGIYWVASGKTFQEVTDPLTDYAIAVDYYDGADHLSIAWVGPDDFHDSHRPERMFTVRHISRSLPVGPDDITGFFSEPINRGNLIKPIEEVNFDPVNRPNHYQGKADNILMKQTVKPFKAIIINQTQLVELQKYLFTRDIWWGEDRGDEMLIDLCPTAFAVHVNYHGSDGRLSIMWQDSHVFEKCATPERYFGIIGRDANGEMVWGLSPFMKTAADFTDGQEVGLVNKPTHYQGSFIEPTSRGKIKSDGSTASYYDLPKGVTKLQHLISDRDMNAQIGEIFRACYRYGLVEHSPKVRDIKKIIFYAQAELERLEALEPKCEARQYSDQMYCSTCETTWDMNDPYPPECKNGEVISQ